MQIVIYVSQKKLSHQCVCSRFILRFTNITLVWFPLQCECVRTTIQFDHCVPRLGGSLQCGHTYVFEELRQVNCAPHVSNLKGISNSQYCGRACVNVISEHYMSTIYATHISHLKVLSV